jgi:hypothetical protein
VSDRGTRFLDPHTQMRALHVLSVMKPEGQTFVADLSVTPMTVQEVKEYQVAMLNLAWALTEILGGTDARNIFGQLGRPKPKQDARNFTCGVAFWAARAALGPAPEVSMVLAIEAARSAMRKRGYTEWNLTDARIKEIAKKLRPACFVYLGKHAVPVSLPKPFVLPVGNPQLGGAPIAGHVPFAGMYLVTRDRFEALKRYHEKRSRRAA